MKRLLNISLALLISTMTFGQATVSKTTGTILGKGKMLSSLNKELLLDNFSLNLTVGVIGEVTGAKMVTFLSEVDADLAQGMSDEAFMYYTSKWEERGFKVVSGDRSKIEGNKGYQKRAAKELSMIKSGEVWMNDGWAVHKMMMAYPTGMTVAVNKMNELGYVITPATFSFNGDFNIGSTYFTSQVDYVEFGEDWGNVYKGTPKLKLSNNMSVGSWIKGKPISYTSSNTATSEVEFITSVDQEDQGFNFKANKEAYRSNVMAMVKQSIDALFADLDAVIAENTK